MFTLFLQTSTSTIGHINFLPNFFWVSCTEEDELNLLLQRVNVLFIHFGECLEIAFFVEENISLVDNEALQLREVDLRLPTSLECILKFAQRCDNDMCTFSFARGGEVGHVDV